MAPFEIPHPYIPNRAMEESDEQRCVECEEVAEHGYHRMEPPKAHGRRKPALNGDWEGPSPFWLMCQTPSDGNVGIDIDVSGWVEEHKSLMRSPGTWFLMAKRTSSPVFVVVLEEGDQFYFAKRHVGDVLSAKEVVAFGIGKKRADGTTVNLWMLPNGVVCGGGDVDVLGARML